MQLRQHWISPLFVQSLMSTESESLWQKIVHHVTTLPSSCSRLLQSTLMQQHSLTLLLYIKAGMGKAQAEEKAAAKENAQWRYNNYRRLARQQWGVDPEA